MRDLDLGQATLTVQGKTGQREIHLAPDALRQLRRLASGKRPDEFLLTTADGRPWSKGLHQRLFAAAAAKAGLDPATNAYCLRHSFISHALRNGVPVKAISDNCGTSLAMVQKYYARFIRSDLAQYAQQAEPTLRGEAVKVLSLRPAGA